MSSVKTRLPVTLSAPSVLRMDSSSSVDGDAVPNRPVISSERPAGRTSLRSPVSGLTGPGAGSIPPAGGYRFLGYPDHPAVLPRRPPRGRRSRRGGRSLTEARLLADRPADHAERLATGATIIFFIA